MRQHYEPLLGPCGKRIYPNKSVAKHLKRRINDGSKGKVQPYHCTKCHGWHLGSSQAGGSFGRRPRVKEEMADGQ